MSERMVHRSKRSVASAHRGEHRIGRQRRRRGAALLFAVFVMMIASAMVVSITDSQVSRYSALRNTRDWDRARYVAEAGLNHALCVLERDITWRRGIPPTEFPVGSNDRYEVRVSDGPDATIVLRVLGESGDFNRTLMATVKQGG